jgi:hypothetical protein
MPYRRRAFEVLSLFGFVVVQACSGSAGDGLVQPPDDALPPNDPIPARSVFPPDNAWNRDVSADPVDPNSAPLMCGSSSPPSGSTA